jgi:hypothetical protein
MLAVAAGVLAFSRAPQSYAVVIPVIDEKNTAYRVVQHPVSTSWWWLSTRGIRVSACLLVLGNFLYGLMQGGNVMLLFIMISVSFGLKLRMRWLATLPVSVRSQARLMVLIYVVLPLAVYTLGCTIASGFQYGRTMRANSPYATGDYDEVENRTRVPFAFWERSATIHPMVTAPWGERSPAYTVQLLGRQYHNPYSTDAASSDSFVNWQYARATKAVYDTTLARTAGGSDQTTYPLRTNSSPKIQLLFFGTMATVLILMLWLMEVARDRTLIRSVLWDKVGTFIFTIPFFAIMGFSLIVGRHLPNALESVINRVLFQLAQALPNSLLLTLLIAAAPVVGAYSLLEWQTKRSEPERLFTAL